jgi:hypothetical protein
MGDNLMPRLLSITDLTIFVGLIATLIDRDEIHGTPAATRRHLRPHRKPELAPALGDEQVCQSASA